MAALKPTFMADLNYDNLGILQKDHPGWRLLRSDHAPLIVSFLNRAFIKPNIRIMPEPVLAEALEDDLFALRERFGAEAFPRTGREYLIDWASPDKGWLRRFYPRGTDEAHYDLVPSTERVISWLIDLDARSFVGTESRLLMLFDLLRQMATGSETDPASRVAELQKRRDAIDEEIRLTIAGTPALLDDTAMRDRFQQFTQMARELLSDFREVEQNFRVLDRSVREKIALWEGGKAMLLDDIMGRRDAIEDSDQGRSFRAFWDFLMSDQRQQELTLLLDSILAHPAVQTTGPDPRLRRIHYDWLQAGDHTQRTVADLSAQLRRFLDNQAWLENRRIMDLLRGIEAKAINVRSNQPVDSEFMELRETSADINLPFERPLYFPPFKPTLASAVLAASGEEVDASALFTIKIVDKAGLASHIRHSLQNAHQVTLRELIEKRPLEHGLAEVVTYLELASTSFTVTVDDTTEETLHWQVTSDEGVLYRKSLHLPRVIFIR